MTRKQKRLLVAIAIRVTVAVIGFTGFLLLFSAVGSLEQDLIGFKQFFIQFLSGLAMFGTAIEVSNRIF